MTSSSSEAFITDYEGWPKWPYLPVIKRSDVSFPECMVLTREKDGFVLYDANLWHLPPTREEFVAKRVKIYATAAEVVADGWEPD